MKVFMAILNSFQMNNPYRVKICCLDCLFRATPPYKFITDSANKKRATPSPFLTID